jgi:hypothetical protein
MVSNIMPLLVIIKVGDVTNDAGLPRQAKDNMRYFKSLQLRLRFRTEYIEETRNYSEKGPFPKTSFPRIENFPRGYSNRQTRVGGCNNGSPVAAAQDPDIISESCQSPVTAWLELVKVHGHGQKQRSPRSKTESEYASLVLEA